MGKDRLYTDIRLFLRTVKLLEINHDTRVVVNNENNTVIATRDGKTVAQWFGPSGFITEECIALTEPKPSAEVPK
jgi:hypothetical protein